MIVMTHQQQHQQLCSATTLQQAVSARRSPRIPALPTSGAHCRFCCCCSCRKEARKAQLKEAAGKIKSSGQDQQVRSSRGQRSFNRQPRYDAYPSIITKQLLQISTLAAICSYDVLAHPCPRPAPPLLVCVCCPN